MKHLLLIGLLLGTGCHSTFYNLWNPKDFYTTQRTSPFPILHITPSRPNGIVIIMMPGTQNTSRYGVMDTDGFVPYSSKIPVYQALGQTLATLGAEVYTYDKRTCTKAHDAACQAMPTKEVNQEGPKALAKDLDALCDTLSHKQIQNLWIWAPTQAGQVAFVSECAKKAKGILWVSPILGNIENSLVAELRNANLSKKANNLEAFFESLKEGLFDKDAFIMGSSYLFWKSWIDLSKQTPQLLRQLSIPVWILYGGASLAYGPKEEAWFEQFSKGGLHKVYKIEGGDHNLLAEEKVPDMFFKSFIKKLATYH